jgi:hypothetical protein
MSKPAWGRHHLGRDNHGRLDLAEAHADQAQHADVGLGHERLEPHLPVDGGDDDEHHQQEHQNQSDDGPNDPGPIHIIRHVLSEQPGYRIDLGPHITSSPRYEN